MYAFSEIRDPSVLPVLRDVLKSFSLFSRQRLNLLKLEIITSLVQDPAEEILPMLRKIASSRSGELAVRAGQMMKMLKVDKT